MYLIHPYLLAILMRSNFMLIWTLHDISLWLYFLYFVLRHVYEKWHKEDCAIDPFDSLCLLLDVLQIFCYFTNVHARLQFAFKWFLLEVPLKTEWSFILCFLWGPGHLVHAIASCYKLMGVGKKKTRALQRCIISFYNLSSYSESRTFSLICKTTWISGATNLFLSHWH